MTLLSSPMTTTPTPSSTSASDWPSDPRPLRCVACHGALGAGESPGAASLVCNGCGRVYPIRDGVLVVKDELAADNRIAADFYNSPLWPKFRFWEWFFFVTHGGERRARNVILEAPAADRRA